MIEPLPTRIYYYCGEHKTMFNNYPKVHIEEGLPKFNDQALDGRETMPLIVEVTVAWKNAHSKFMWHMLW